MTVRFRRHLGEAALIGAYGALATPILYAALKIPFILLGIALTQGSYRDNASWIENFYLLYDDPIYIPPPALWLWAITGAICALAWLSGGPLCRRWGSFRHGDMRFYNSPENRLARHRFLGGIAAVPSFFAVWAYYASALFWAIPAYVGIGAWGLGYFAIRGPVHEELEWISSLPALVGFYVVKALLVALILAVALSVSIAIGAACGWFYGRFVRPAVARIFPRLRAA